jgi:hypothetical protein
MGAAGFEPFCTSGIHKRTTIHSRPNVVSCTQSEHLFCMQNPNLCNKLN